MYIQLLKFMIKMRLNELFVENKKTRNDCSIKGLLKEKWGKKVKQYKVKYVVISRFGEKVLFIKTVNMNFEELSDIGDQIKLFLKMYQDVNVLFKVMKWL